MNFAGQMTRTLEVTMTTLNDLIVVRYVPGTRRLEESSLKKNATDEYGQIAVDIDKETWTFIPSAERVRTQTFGLGAGLRVPNGGEYFGPAMVYNPADPDHRAAYNNFKKDFEAGRPIDP